MTTRKMRVYELPQAQYALVHDVKARLGVIVSCEVESVLGGQIPRFQNVTDDELRIIRELAVKRNVKLPCG